MIVTDISFDLETLGCRHDAPIVSVGATAFNRDTGEIGNKFYVEVNIDDAIRYGHVNGSTLCWWMRQSEEARRVFTAGDAVQDAKPPLATAMRQLSDFVLIAGGPNVRVWGNGATFDVTILEHALSKTHSWAPLPWAFWNIRDMRTLIDTATELGFDKRSIAFDGVAHNALDDSAHQAKVISAAWRHVTQPVRGGEVPIPAVATAG